MCACCLLLPEYCEVDWNAEFVHAYEAGETRRRQQEQRQSYWQDHGQGPFGGQDPQEFFQQVGVNAVSVSPWNARAAAAPVGVQRPCNSQGSQSFMGELGQTHYMPKPWGNWT